MTRISRIIVFIHGGTPTHGQLDQLDQLDQENEFFI
jgi:hypothetical protein